MGEKRGLCRVTAGASAPDILVQNVISRLQELGGGEAVPLEGREENIVFEVPKGAAYRRTRSRVSFLAHDPEWPATSVAGIFIAD